MRTRTILSSVAAVSAALAGALAGVASHALLDQAAGVSALTSNCQFAYQHPHSGAADQCRQHGWTINGRLTVTPRGVVQADQMKHCATDDGTAPDGRCIWIGSRDGNGRGLSYWVDHTGRIHYVWPHRPTTKRSLTHPNWRWVDSELADALAESGAPHADTRDWQRCVVRYDETTVVRCPDGTEETS